MRIALVAHAAAALSLSLSLDQRKSSSSSPALLSSWSLRKVAEEAVSGEKERDGRSSAEIRHDKYNRVDRVVAREEMRRALTG